MPRAMPVMAGVTAALWLAACGDDNGSVRTATVPAAETATQTSTSPPVDGDPILIETRVTDIKNHKGKVLGVSRIGESAFCRGGKTSGGSEGALITSTFHCSDGTLKVRFAPTQRSVVQGAPWEIVSGTGSYKGLRGGGSMVAKFDDPATGGEIFTGIVSK